MRLYASDVFLSMNVTLKLELEDWRQFQSFLEKDLQKSVKSWWNGHWFTFLFSVSLCLAILLALEAFGGIHWPTAGSVALLLAMVIGLHVAHLFKLRQAFSPSDSGIFVGEHRFDFGEDGIKIAGQDYETWLSWDRVQRIERSDDMIMIFLDTAFAYLFPVSKLDDPDGLYACLIDHWDRK